MKNNLAQRFWRDRRGVAAVEYVVLMTGIAAVIIGAISSAGAGVSSKLNLVASSLSDTAVSDDDGGDVGVAIPVARPIGRPVMATPIMATADSL